MTPAPRALLALFLALSSLAFTQTVTAQTVTLDSKNLGVRPEVLPWDQGEAGLHLLFKKLKTTGRVMMLTAHPDDEDGPTLTLQARGHGQQVLLMSLTRGEGGQNRTGSNLWDELGVLRTLELLESTRYYGTELRFSRVADFGFSKSADETFKKWGGHEVPLRDIVYVIREWKPDVFVSRWSGTPRDGHGNHQAAGILAPEAVKCAADPNCFPDQLKGDHALTTWQVLKFYAGNQGSGGENTVSFDVNQIDPDTKLSYFQMAMEGFKHQASQLSGTFTIPPSANWRSYKLISSSLPNYQPKPGMKEQDFFDGIDTSVQGLSSRFRLRDGNAELMFKVATSNLTAALEHASVDSLTRARVNLASTIRGSSEPFKQRAQQIEQEALTAGTKLLKLSATAIVRQQYAERDSTSRAVVKVLNRGSDPVNIASISIRPDGPGVFELREPIHRVVAPGQSSEDEIPFSVNGYLPVTAQHWHRIDPERDTVYEVDSPLAATWALPHRGLRATIQFDRDRPIISVPLTSGDPKGTQLAISNPISILFSATGQVHTPTQSSFEIKLRLISITRPGAATVKLTAPFGWMIAPRAQSVQLKAGQESEVTFKAIAVHVKPGQALFQAEATFDGEKYSNGFSTVTRDDLDTFYYYQPAIQRVSIVDVNVPKSLRVGYVPGAGDDIFPVLEQLGLNAKQISDQELASGDLHQYDTIVVGIRGYDERPQIRDNNRRLLDFVKGGGTLIVQNQKAEDVFNSGKFTPYPATLGRERVSVEEAPVEVLAPNDPIWAVPNKITPADFDGWVQERGVNFMSQWDDHFEPLLASGDPGEQPLKGGLLRAKYGKGTYIYTGYAFFRQLPAGVPGAVRLYVNLLNAGHDAK